MYFSSLTYFVHPQPTEDMSDDFMFPMSKGMSYGAGYMSGADSDAELPRPRDDFDLKLPQKKRLMRSSSDPSVNTHENIPGIPPYPQPPTYKNQRVSYFDSFFSLFLQNPPQDLVVLFSFEILKN